MSTAAPFELAARRLRLWIGSIVVFIVIVILSAPSETLTALNLLPSLALNALLLYGFLVLARRVRAGRAAGGALAALILHSLLGTGALFAAFAFGARSNYPIAVAAWLFVCVCAFLSIRALLPCLNGTVDPPSTVPGAVVADDPDALLTGSERVHQILRDRHAKNWKHFAGVAPETPLPNHPFMRASQVLLGSARSVVDYSFVLAAGLVRRRGDWAAARSVLTDALTTARSADAQYRSGAWDPAAQAVRTPLHTAELLTQLLLLEVLVGSGVPAWAGDWSSEEACDAIRGAPGVDAPLFPEVFHAVRSVLRHDRELAEQVRRVTHAMPPRGQPWERGLVRWVTCVTDTARALVVEGVDAGAAALRAQLDAYGQLDKTYKEATSGWIADLPDDHQQLSIDWTAVVTCRAFPELFGRIQPPSPFVPRECQN